VEERALARTEPPEELLPNEGALFRLIASRPRGRLEQEFLPIELVTQSIREWRLNSVSAEERD
jgi:hypothetical protein